MLETIKCEQAEQKSVLKFLNNWAAREIAQHTFSMCKSMQGMLSKAIQYCSKAPETWFSPVRVRIESRLLSCEKKSFFEQ